jgi:hypothetical protein
MVRDEREMVQCTGDMLEERWMCGWGWTSSGFGKEVEEFVFDLGVCRP